MNLASSATAFRQSWVATPTNRWTSSQSCVGSPVRTSEKRACARVSIFAINSRRFLPRMVRLRRYFDMGIGLASVCAGQEIVSIPHNVGPIAAIVLLAEIEYLGRHLGCKFADAGRIRPSELINSLLRVCERNQPAVLAERCNHP